MAQQVSDAEFSSAAGVEDWRVLSWGAKTLYHTGDFATGARFVSAIAVEAEALGHAPDPLACTSRARSHPPPTERPFAPTEEC